MPTRTMGNCVPLLAAGLCGVQTVKISRDRVQRVSQTTRTPQVTLNPPLRRGPATHDRAVAVQAVVCH